jgi:hypothetical protein
VKSGGVTEIAVALRATLWVTGVDVPALLDPELSVTTAEAVKLPAFADVKVMLSVQLAPAASETPQVLVCEKAAALVPEKAMDVMLRGALPVLVSVAVCAAGVVPALAENVSVAGVSEATGVPATVPLNGTAWVEGEALSVATSDAL